MDTLVTRQPIFDRREALVGYELLLRPGTQPEAAGDPATRDVVTETALGVGVDRVAAGYQAFVTVDRSMLASGALESLSPDRVIFQIRPRPDSGRAWLHACADL